MSYEDKVAFMAAILLSARIGRGNAVDKKEMLNAINYAKELCALVSP